MNKEKLKRILNTVSSFEDEVSDTFNSLDSEMASIVSKLKETTTAKTLDKVNAEFQKISDKLKPLIGAIEDFKKTFIEKDKLMTERLNEKIKEFNTALDDNLNDNSEWSNNLKKLIDEIKIELSNLDKNKSVELKNLQVEIAKTFVEVENTIDLLNKGIVKSDKEIDSVKKTITEAIKELEEKLASLKSDLMSRLGHGGNANRQLKVSGTDSFTRYTDLNFVAGSGITLATANDDTNRRVNLTITSSGAGYTNLTQFVDQTPWQVFYSDGSGDVIELALGSDGTFLKSNGASSAPTFATPAGSGDVTKVGTPVNNQVGVWTGDGTIEGDTALTFDTTTDTLATVLITATTVTANLTGNASGSAATVTTAAQPAITSLGTLTTLTVDNILINGNDISSLAGTDLTITPLAGQQIVLDGTIVIDAGVVTGATSITSTAFVGALTGNADTATNVAVGGITGLGANVATFLATPSSANLASAVTGETGSGALVFGTSPDFTTGATIGSVAIPTISSTNTLTNKRITARVATTANDATAVIDSDSVDEYYLTAMSAATEISVTGTPTTGQTIFIGLKDDGTGRALTWTGITALGVTLPTTTTANKQHIIGLKYIGAWFAVGVSVAA